MSDQDKIGELEVKVKELTERLAKAEADKWEAEGFLASMMDTVNQELRENGPVDVGQYYRRHDANNGVRYLVDLLNRKGRDAEARCALLASALKEISENGDGWSIGVALEALAPKETNECLKSEK